MTLSPDVNLMSCLFIYEKDSLKPIILHCLCSNPTAIKTFNRKLWSETGIEENTLFKISGLIMLLGRLLGTLKKTLFYQKQFHNYVTNQNKITK